MKLTYRQVRRAHRALQEIGVIRDGGMKQSGDSVAYVGKLVLPRRAKLRTRSMLRTLGALDEDLLEQEREMAKEAEADGDDAALRKLQKDNLDLLNMEVPEDVDIQPLKATDLGDDALDHIPDALLVNLGPLFLEDGDEDGAGDPRNREERRAEV